MGNNLVMSQKERDHLIAIKQVVKGRLSGREAANLLKLTRRHVFRMLKRYRAATDVGPHRRKRPRRTAIGELVQFDGSDHDWFEGRGPECTLLHFIDDATSTVFLRFAPSENTADCMRAFWDYVDRYGFPRCLYIDRGSVFWADGGRLTEFGRAMASLGVQMIFANSSQAKGRVERSLLLPSHCR